MPFDFTLPGYNYCGPGTKTTTAEPVNVLDGYCMDHDQFYEMHADAASRYVADLLLAKLAWVRFFSPDPQLGERIVCLLVYGAMSIKTRLYKRQPQQSEAS